ncbi:hypothetical protein AB1I63_01675 [Streptococcus pneumoniae]
MAGSEITDQDGGIIDLPHLAVTTLSYYNFTINLGSWNGWAGDLASSMGSVQKVYNVNKNSNLDAIARAFVGGSLPTSDVLKGVTIPNGIGNPFGYADMCSDADAIGLAIMMKKEKAGNSRLSTTMSKYYNGQSNSRYNNYLSDLGVSRNLTAIENAIDKVFKSFPVKLYNLTKLESGQDVDSGVKKVTQKALANYIYQTTR